MDVDYEGWQESEVNFYDCLETEVSRMDSPQYVTVPHPLPMWALISLHADTYIVQDTLLPSVR